MVVPHYAYLTSKSQDPKEQSQYKEALKYPTLVIKNAIG
jgi:hypothetical protein